jgi:hypothetical protein
MPDGRTPGPGGWNRIHFLVDDIAADVERLRAAGLTFRNDIIRGPGGRQILLEDPSGNPIELFQPAGARSKDRWRRVRSKKTLSSCRFASRRVPLRESLCRPGRPGRSG